MAFGKAVEAAEGLWVTPAPPPLHISDCELTLCTPGAQEAFFIQAFHSAENNWIPKHPLTFSAA